MNTKLILLISVLSILLTNCKALSPTQTRTLNQLETIHQNVLLVRLPSANHKIQHFKENHQLKAAQETATAIAAEQDATIAAFAEQFDFCEVYFFHAQDAKALKVQQFDDIHMIDTQKVPVTEKAFLKKGYLVATFKDNELLVLNENYDQLQRPFPCSILTHMDEGYQVDAVAALNDKITLRHFSLLKKKMKRERRQ